MDKNFINIDLDDPKTGIVAEALSNKTCVKILTLLAQQELTASDIATQLKIPLNTTGYNIEKLIAGGLVEKSSEFFWSVKGKKTPVYRVANKKIIITPKRSIKGTLPAIIASGVFALILKSLISIQNKGVGEATPLAAIESASASALSSTTTSLLNLGWVWFIAGALFSLIIASLWDWFSYRKAIK